jgi:selenocysteine lyase/cysteine desulfurase
MFGFCLAENELTREWRSGGVGKANSSRPGHAHLASRVVGCALGHAGGVAAPFSSSEIQAIRDTTPGCRDELIHLNHAGSSLPDQRVLDRQMEHLHLEAMIGGYEAAAAAGDAQIEVTASIARLLSVGVTEIARVEHATAAWNAAFWSIPMRAGQRIITHDQDYGANWIAFLRAAEIHGVLIDRISSDRFGQIDLERLAIALERPDDVAVVSLAWIPTSGGLVNPAAAVGALTRAADVPFLLDACQAVGQLDIDANAIGCDFLSATGRKYLRGPRGTGFLYVREESLDRFVPSQPDHHGADWSSMESYTFVEGAARFEHWEYSHAAWLGLGAAIDTALELGLDRIQATIGERAKELRAGVTEAGFAVHDDGIAKCGIVTATHPTLPASDVMAALSHHNINATTTYIGSARADMEARGLAPMVRLSVHCTTTPDEIERTTRVLAALQ